MRLNRMYLMHKTSHAHIGLTTGMQATQDA
jgi:hypothetical protein